MYIHLFLHIVILSIMFLTDSWHPLKFSKNVFLLPIRLQFQVYNTSYFVSS
jgi:hypothetical protein